MKHLIDVTRHSFVTASLIFLPSLDGSSWVLRSLVVLLLLLVRHRSVSLTIVIDLLGDRPILLSGPFGALRLLIQRQRLQSAGVVFDKYAVVISALEVSHALHTAVMLADCVVHCNSHPLSGTEVRQTNVTDNSFVLSVHHHRNAFLKRLL